jgi:YVTN family beta-propeller protein
MRTLTTILLLTILLPASVRTPATGYYLSPGALVVDELRSIVYTTLTTAKAIAVTDLKTGQTTGRIALKQNPNSIIFSPKDESLYVSSGSADGSVEIIDRSKNKVKRSISVGHTPQEMALAENGKTLFVANRFSNSVSVVDLKAGKVTAEIPTLREPRRLCISPDGKTVVVANFLPAQAANDTIVAAEIMLIDVPTRTVRANVTLPNGSQSVAGVTCSSDGKYFYAVHLLSHYDLPITQLDRGWVNTNALSIIDINSNSLYATVLLDDVNRGAANPAGICTGKDETLYIALSGTHEVMSIYLKGLHTKLAELFSGKSTDAYIRDRDDLSTSLSFTFPYKKRVTLQGRSPREVAYASDKIYVSSYFSTFLEAIPVGSEETPVVLSLGEESMPDGVRRGEMAFHDASICYQQWQSCASCHPDGRADGLNWDQQNDGLGNPKNTKSLLYSHVTPPCMITGIRESAELAVRKGILHTLGTDQSEHIAADMDEYLKHLTPVESPFLREYRKKDPGQTGKKLFEQAGCSQCHNGKYLTDMQKYDVAVGIGDDTGRAFDTPSLKEIWRTAPYLYDGRAVTLEEIFTKYNAEDKHGLSGSLSKKELKMLVLYLKTL